MKPKAKKYLKDGAKPSGKRYASVKALVRNKPGPKRLTVEQIHAITNDISEDMCQASKQDLMQCVRYWSLMCERYGIQLNQPVHTMLLHLLDLQKDAVHFRSTVSNEVWPKT